MISHIEGIAGWCQYLNAAAKGLYFVLWKTKTKSRWASAPFSLSSSFMTPLHVAAERAHNDIMEVLQKHGAKVNHSIFISLHE